MIFIDVYFSRYIFIYRFKGISASYSPYLISQDLISVTTTTTTITKLSTRNSPNKMFSSVWKKRTSTNHERKKRSFISY